MSQLPVRHSEDPDLPVVLPRPRDQQLRRTLDPQAHRPGQARGLASVPAPRPQRKRHKNGRTSMATIGRTAQFGVARGDPAVPAPLSHHRCRRRGLPPVLAGSAAGRERRTFSIASGIPPGPRAEPPCARHRSRACFRAGQRRGDRPGTGGIAAGDLTTMLASARRMKQNLFPGPQTSVRESRQIIQQE